MHHMNIEADMVTPFQINQKIIAIFFIHPDIKFHVKVPTDQTLAKFKNLL